MSAPLLIPIVEAGRRLGVGKTSAYELVKTGELPTVQFAGKRLVPAAACDEIVARLVEQTEAGEAA